MFVCWCFFVHNILNNWELVKEEVWQEKCENQNTSNLCIWAPLIKINLKKYLIHIIKKGEEEYIQNMWMKSSKEIFEKSINKL